MKTEEIESRPESKAREAVENFIAEIDSKFDLVLITELFDESLILMKELFGWSLEEISYISQNRRKSSYVEKMKPMTKVILRRWLWADVLLYDHFRYVFSNK